MTDTQDAEHRHNVRKLSNHPSIVLYDGCNECQVKMGTGTAIYATFVMTVVGEEDNSRSMMPSCPSIGWDAGVDKLYVRASGNKLTTPDKATTTETHGAYNHGWGIPSENGHPGESCDSLIPVKVDSSQESKIGVDKFNIMHSEFGTTVYSSFESMSATLDPKHWSIHGGEAIDNCTGHGFSSECKGPNPMQRRNYAEDNIIELYFGKPSEGWDVVGEKSFKRALYYSMVA